MTCTRNHGTVTALATVRAGLPSLADLGYEGAADVIHVPIKKKAGQHKLSDDQHTYNKLLRGLRRVGERANALLIVTFKGPAPGQSRPLAHREVALPGGQGRPEVNLTRCSTTPVQDGEVQGLEQQQAAGTRQQTGTVQGGGDGALGGENSSRGNRFSTWYEQDSR